MRALIFILAIILLSACSPCKYVAKHPECFQADTVIKTERIVHHEKEYITNDSIIHDTVIVEGDEKEIIKTIYRTNWKEKTDTIYRYDKTTKINPINTQLQIKYDKAQKQANRYIKSTMWLSIALLLLIVLIGLYIYIRK